MSECVRPYVNVGLCVCGGYCRKPSVCVVCLQGILSIYHCGCLPCRCGSFVCVCHRVSVRLSASVTGIRLGSRVSRSRLLGRETVEVAARGGGEGWGRRQWEGAGAPCGPEWVCAGGRRRRLSDSAQPALGNLGRLQPPARHGAARPGLAASGESPAPPGTFPRPVAYYASGGRCTPEGSKPPNRTPAAPPGLPSDALHRPTLILNSSLAAADFRSPSRPHGNRHPAGLAAASVLDCLWGPRSPPFPRSSPSLGPLQDAPCLLQNPGCAGSWSPAGPT